jgi:hypothetical protein
LRGLPAVARGGRAAVGDESLAQPAAVEHAPQRGCNRVGDLVLAIVAVSVRVGTDDGAPRGQPAKGSRSRAACSRAERDELRVIDAQRLALSGDQISHEGGYSCGEEGGD